MPLIEETLMTAASSERLLTPKDVCERLQISAVTGWRLYSERGLKVIRIGRAIRVRESDLQAWLEKNTSGGGDGGGATSGKYKEARI
jgi:excisionase family DNA binding protein